MGVVAALDVTKKPEPRPTQTRSWEVENALSLRAKKEKQEEGKRKQLISVAGFSKVSPFVRFPRVYVIARS